MRITWAGTFEPGFSRNRKLHRLLELLGVETVVVREAVWGLNLFELASRSRLRTALLAVMRYPVLLFRLLITPRPDLYLVSYPGWFDVPIVKLVARLKRRPLVFDPFVSLFDTLVSDRALYPARSLVGRVAYAIDQWALRMADLVLADTESHIDFYQKLTNGRLKNGRVLPVGADDIVFVPRPDVAVTATRVLFYGTLIPLQGVATIVEAAALLQPMGIHVTIIGDGQQRETLDEAIARTGVSVERHGNLPLGELPRHIARSGVCLGIFGDSSKAERVVPHKVYEYLAVGRPVVTREGAAIRAAFSDQELVTVAPSDPQAIAEAVASLVNDEGRREHIAGAGHAAYRERFHEDALAERLHSAFAAVTESPGAS